ncbi:thermonuclease family protein [Escherichia coli]
MKFKFIILLMALPLSVLADIEGKVVRILDGDTLDVLQEGNKISRIRLEGIDAPEKSQPYGQRSRQMLTMLTANKWVNVKSHGSDRYGRILGEIYSPDNINEKMITTGMAWAYRYHGKPTNEKYLIQENKARSNKSGLWADPDAIEPWKWRKNNR